MKTNMILTLFFFWPFGILAMKKSLQCRVAINEGNYLKANALSKDAWFVGLNVFAVGLVFNICMLALVVVIGTYYVLGRYKYVY